jgi:hypothetical protein
MAGLVPAVPLMRAQCHPERGRRDKPGDDSYLNAVSTSRTQYDVPKGMASSLKLYFG